MIVDGEETLVRLSPARGGGGMDVFPSPVLPLPFTLYPLSGCGTAPGCGIGGPSYCGTCVVLVGLGCTGAYADAAVLVGAG